MRTDVKGVDLSTKDTKVTKGELDSFQTWNIMESCRGKLNRRTSILLIGGDKTGDDRFYEVLVPIADELYDEHLEELRREGLIQ